MKAGYPQKDSLVSGNLGRNSVYSTLVGRWVMKTMVVYDSLYGNTKTIAQTVGDALPGEVEVLHVGKAPVSGFEAYELLVVGAPTHGARPSPDAKKYLDQIPAFALKGMKVASFDTRMTNRLITLFGVAAPKIAKELKAKGGTLVGSPEGFYVTGGEGPLKEGEVEHAAAWAKGLAATEA
jgi:flavodoxin